LIARPVLGRSLLKVAEAFRPGHSRLLLELQTFGLDTSTTPRQQRAIFTLWRL